VDLYIPVDFTPPKSFTSGAEGPAVDKSGILYAVNYGSQGTVGKILPDGQAGVLLRLPENSIGNGIRFNSQGEMLVADYVNHNILKIDVNNRNVSVLTHERGMSQPNDIAIDDHDRLYASDPDWDKNTGKIWRIDPDGTTTLIENSMGTTNGIEVSPDNKTLYVNESVQRRVWAFDLSPDGGIRNKRLLIEFADFELDGMRCDISSNLYIARYGKGTIVKVSPRGKVLKEITLNGTTPSNLAFGGADGCTIYVTIQDMGNIESFRVEAPGRSWKMSH
jgi:gluconolactonase